MKERHQLQKFEWIAKRTPENCPGGLPRDERGWRDLVNRIVKDVRAVLRESDRSGGLLPKHGGYRKLCGLQVSSIVYDATRIFCDGLISRRSRTHDQMVQAARSGRQNIAEGSMASSTSKKMELKLTNVAKASLEELLLDYEDYLRQNNLRLCNKDDPETLAVRQRFRSDPVEWFEAKSDGSDPSDWKDPYETAKAPPEVAANTVICLIPQATYLLKRQIGALEKAFLEEGGFTERLYKKRREHRKNQGPHR